MQLYYDKVKKIVEVWKPACVCGMMKQVMVCITI